MRNPTDPPKRLPDRVPGQVSVIIPTYGGRKTLTRTVRSCLAQSYSNVQAIVIDDNEPGSPARLATEEIMREFTHDPKVLYLKHERNKNASAARNTGLSAATGEYLNFLDDDDWFLPEKLAIQVPRLEASDAEAIYCGWVSLSGPRFQTFSGRPVLELLLMDYQPVGPTLLFEADPIYEIGGWDPSFRRHQDFELMLRYFEKFSVEALTLPLICLGANDGENVLHGKDLEELKAKFLSQFDPTIQKLEIDRPGTRDLIHARHYAAVMVDHLHRRHTTKAAKLAFRMLRAAPLAFATSVARYLTTRIVLKIRRKLRRGSQ